MTNTGKEAALPPPRSAFWPSLQPHLTPHALCLEIIVSYLKFFEFASMRGNLELTLIVVLTRLNYKCLYLAGCLCGKGVPPEQGSHLVYLYFPRVPRLSCAQFMFIEFMNEWNVSCFHYLECSSFTFFTCPTAGHLISTLKYDFLLGILPWWPLTIPALSCQPQRKDRAMSPSLLPQSPSSSHVSLPGPYQIAF